MRRSPSSAGLSQGRPARLRDQGLGVRPAQAGGRSWYLRGQGAFFRNAGPRSPQPVNWLPGRRQAGAVR